MKYFLPADCKRAYPVSSIVRNFRHVLCPPQKVAWFGRYRAQQVEQLPVAISRVAIERFNISGSAR